MDEEMVQGEQVVQEQIRAPKTRRIWVLVLFLIAFLGLVVFTWYFLATPFQPVGDPVEPFAGNKFALAERVTYLFQQPKVGDGIIFEPKNDGIGDANYIGIIIDVKNDANLTSYTVISKKGKPWEMTRDKIKARVYYPAITQDHLESARLVDVKAWLVMENWKLYINNPFLFELKHPEQIEFVHNTPNSVVGRIKREFFLSEGDYFEFDIDISDETPETLMGIYDYGEKQEVEILGQMVSVYSGTGSEAGAYPFKMFILTNRDKSYFFKLSTFRYWAVIDQILSTFKFLDQAVSVTPSPTAKPQTAISLTYALPAGWRTATDLSQTFEIGYDPNMVEAKPLHLDNGLFITDISGTRSIIGGFSTTDYDGGSRHLFLKQQMGESLIESDKLPDFREEEYVIQGKRCLVYNGYYISASGPVWGMCPISAAKALFFNTARDNLETTLRTIRFF